MKNVLQHALTKIKEAKIETDIPGYPYFSVDGIFPEDYYLELVSIHKNMQIQNFKQLSKNYTNRYVYDLNSGENANSKRNDFSDLSFKERVFWLNFQNTFLVDDVFKNAFLQKYENHIDFPYPQFMSSTCRLQRDFKGYKIGPHRDNLDKIFSVMIYTPTIEMDEELLEDHGTAICIPKFDDAEKVPMKEGHVGSGSNRHFLFEEVDIVRTAKAKPNNLFSWAVADRSYHAVTPLKSELVRSTIAYFVKVPKNVMHLHKLYGWENFKC